MIRGVHQVAQISSSLFVRATLAQRRGSGLLTRTPLVFLFVVMGIVVIAIALLHGVQQP